VKALGVVFAVVFLGLGIFYLGLSYLYKGALDLGACDLCFKLNPDLAECKDYAPFNFSAVINFPVQNLTLNSNE
jgi:hypothetical protein